VPSSVRQAQGYDAGYGTGPCPSSVRGNPRCFSRANRCEIQNDAAPPDQGPHQNMTPSDTQATPTLRHQIDSLPAYILSVWRGRYANEGTDLEARAIIDREAATIRSSGATADALAVWMRLADAAGRMREPPPALVAAAALAGLAAAYARRGLRYLSGRKKVKVAFQRVSHCLSDSLDR